MVHRVTFEIEHHTKPQMQQLAPNDYGLIKAMLDYDMIGPALIRATTCSEVARGHFGVAEHHSRPQGDNRLGFDQQRTGELSFTRRLWVEFDTSADAVLFKLTWDAEIKDN